MSEQRPSFNHDEQLERLATLERALIYDAMLFDHVVGRLGIEAVEPLGYHADHGVAAWETRYKPVMLPNAPDGTPGPWKLQLSQKGRHVSCSNFMIGDSLWASMLTSSLRVFKPRQPEPLFEITLPDTSLHTDNGIPIRRLADPIALYREVMAGESMDALDLDQIVFSLWLEAVRRHRKIEALDFPPSAWPDI